MLTPVIDTSKEYGLVLKEEVPRAHIRLEPEGTERGGDKDQCCGRNECRSIEWRADLYG